MRKVFKTYLKRLTNLTSRNRSLLLLRLPTRQFIDIHALQPTRLQPIFEVVAQLMARAELVPLCDYLDPRDERTNDLSKQLQAISKTEQLIAEERGSEDLFVGFPMVQGKLTDGSLIRCPLLFFPVTLSVEVVKKKPMWCLRKRQAEVQLNRSFLLAYSYFNQVPIHDNWLEFSTEDFPTEPLPFLTKLYETLQESPLDINFNQQLFELKLSDYQEFKKQDLEESERNGELKLYSQAVLGLYPQAASYLATDYENWLATTTEFPTDWDEMLQPISHATTRIREEDLLLPLAVDASQEAAIREVKEGKSLVIQGPPGTGKSQLIANLLADFAAHGKHALLVCQKRAALDTVANRLAEIGLSPFVGLVHDASNDRKTLFRQIAAQIEQVNAYQQQNKSLDAIFLDRTFGQICRRIDAVVAELDSLKIALFDEQIAGKSAKEMYVERLRNPTTQSFPMTAYFRSFPMHDITELQRKAALFERYARQLFDGSEAAIFWREALPPDLSQWSGATIEVVQESCQQLHAWPSELADLSSKKLGKSLTVNELSEVSEGIFQALTSLLTTDASVRYFSEANLANESERKQAAEKWQHIGRALETIAQQGTILPLPAEVDIPSIITASQAALAVADKPLQRTWFALASPHRQLLNQLKNTYGFAFEKASLSTWIAQLQRTAQFRELAQQMQQLGSSLPSTLPDALTEAKQREKAYQAATTLPPSFKKSAFGQLQSVQELVALIGLVQQWQRHQHQLESVAAKWLADKQIDTFYTLDPTPYTSYLQQQLPHLQGFVQLKNTCSATEWQLFNEAAAAATTALPTLIEINLRDSWLQHLEQVYPILQQVSSFQVEALEEELQRLLTEKQHLCREIVLLKLREQTYASLQKNRLGNVTTYRELYHQVTKKRNLWSVRKLLTEFADEIKQLLPCWLASPETVAAIYPTPSLTNPAERYFDLVVFDEASQCFIEEGLPAALRGKQIVIAGDSKQLPPNELYQIRYEEETEDASTETLDSLLDVAIQFLPQHQLTGHYRSQSLDLLAFSNKHFYQNKLSLLPDYQGNNLGEAAIYYQLVSGVWEKNQNTAEADFITQTIDALPSDETVGIVTFNFKQAELIERKLAEAKQFNWPPIRVKNIENIQGDEFDTVIFSIGYAPDAAGRMMHHFGSLNQQGGENRLNVAITRARKRIVIVASILPHQLHVENTLHIGPKLLKAYLEFAYETATKGFQPTPFQPAFALRNTLADYLMQQTGGKWVAELPFADLVRKTAERYEELILTDDASYFESPSAKHTHGYLPLLLTRKNWPYRRLWSRNKPAL